MAVPTVRPTARQAFATGFFAPPCTEPGQHTLPALDCNDPWLAQLATSLTVEAGTLAEFAARMTFQGFKLELSRFFLDLAYAYRQLAIAHSLADPRLRMLALSLFAACQRLDQRRRELTESAQVH